MPGKLFSAANFRIEVDGFELAGFAALAVESATGRRPVAGGEVALLPAVLGGATAGAAPGSRKWPNLVLKQGAVLSGRLAQWIQGGRPRRGVLVACDGSVRLLLPAVLPVGGIVAPGGGGEPLLLPAVQKVREAASRLKLPAMTSFGLSAPGGTPPSTAGTHVLYQDIAIPSAAARLLLTELQAKGGGEVAMEELVLAHEELSLA